MNAAPLYDIFVMLRILADAHRSAHWCALGSNSYSDHIMFQRLYDDTVKEVDAVAEKLLGHGMRDEAFDPQRIIESMRNTCKQLLVGGIAVESLLDAEKCFIASLDNALRSHDMTSGVENMLQGIADKHEEHVYILSRRLGDAAIRAITMSITVPGCSDE